MSRNPFPFSIALLTVFSLSPIMGYAVGSGDSSSQSLLNGSGTPSTSTGPISPDASSPIPDQIHTLITDFIKSFGSQNAG